MEMLSSVDVFLFRLINGFLGSSPSFDITIIFIAKYAVFILLLLIAISLIRDFSRASYKKFKVHAVVLILTGGVVLLLTKVIRFLYHHDRPFLALGTPHILFEPSYSFPSGHTIFIFGLATATYFYDRPLSYGIFAVGVLVGIARIAAGVHYPLDIIGGIILGILGGLIVEYVTRHWILGVSGRHSTRKRIH